MSQPAATAAPTGKGSEFSRARLEELIKKRFFYAPAFSIYGGVSGLYDYGPPGCSLQANMLAIWRSHFILEENMLEVDTATITPREVLKASGHVDRFTDYLIRDAKTGDSYRADHVLEAALERIAADAATAPAAATEIATILAQMDNYSQEELQALLDRFQVKSEAGNDFTPITKFNLMFAAEIGPTSQFPAFLRPETAQGQFTNFKRLLECNNDRMPFASAQIGKSFRNEISPRQGLLRVREFTMAEIEHFVNPKDKRHHRFAEVASVVLPFLSGPTQMAGSSVACEMTIGEAVAKGIVDNETLGYFLARTAQYMARIGIDAKRLRFRQHLPNEMSHYASDCWDCEIQSSYGWIECVGCADRSAYDLTMHTKVTKEKLVVREALEKPVVVRVRKLDISKKEIGMAYKKDSKDILEALEGLSLEEGEALMAGAVEDGSASGEKVVSVVVNGEARTLTPAMVSMVEYEETLHVNEYIPNVIEPSFGIGRIFYSLLEHVFWSRDGDDQRCVLSFPAAVAPIKVLVAPLSNNEAFVPFSRRVVQLLRKADIAHTLDESSTSIGRRYARNDEIGIPFGITVDFQTATDDSVTMRERDSTEQVRLPIDDVVGAIDGLVKGSTTWAEVVAKYGLFLSS